MSTLTQTSQPAPVPNGDCYSPFRMSIDQYERLVDSGVFTKRDKLQLVNGILVNKVTQNPPHTVVDLRCRKALERVIPANWHVRPDKPVRLPPDGEPAPDQCVVRGEELDYLDRHPGPADVGLLVEVADDSVAEDRKMGLTYGARGIAVYWIVNIPGRQVEVYTSPTSEGYDLAHVYKMGDQVPVILDGIEVGRINVSDILP
jgi:Uma2 family endonuclease